MAARIIDGLGALRAAVGDHFGPSDWTVLSSDRLALFARATGDVDPGNHALVLAVSNELLPQLIEVRGISMGVNYGMDRVRYPADVRAGDRVRARAEITKVTEVTGGVQASITIALERERGVDPETVCVIDSLSRYFA